jgi:hypothetical protein
MPAEIGHEWTEAELLQPGDDALEAFDDEEPQAEFEPDAEAARPDLRQPMTPDDGLPADVLKARREAEAAKSEPAGSPLAMEEEEPELSPVDEEPEAGTTAYGNTLESDEKFTHRLNYMEAKRAVDEATAKMVALGPNPPLHSPGMAASSCSAAARGSSSKMPASFLAAKPKAKRLKTEEEEQDQPFTDYDAPCTWDNLGADPAGFTWEMCESFVIDWTVSKEETKKWAKDKLEPIGLQYLFCYLFVRLLCVCVSVFMCCIL